MISVIVPYRNAENWIGRCIDSLRVQRGRFEFLLVDDHSTDRSTDIVRKHIKGDSRFDFSHLTSLYGVSAARNAGIGNATGDWITFLDADDEMLPNVWDIFQRMIQICDTANIVQANHKGVYNVPVKPNHYGCYTVSRLPHHWCMVWNKLYRRSFLEEHNIRFKEGTQYGEDELFNLTCLKYDDRIFHTQDSTCTTKHYPVIKGSLSYVKTPEQLLQQSRALEDFLLETDSRAMRRVICKMLAERWSHRLLEAFGR